LATAAAGVTSPFAAATPSAAPQATATTTTTTSPAKKQRGKQASVFGTRRDDVRPDAGLHFNRAVDEHRDRSRDCTDGATTDGAVPAGW
jgi:hypothetical protein